MAEEKAKKLTREAPREFILWMSEGYRITYDRANGEMVYRVKIPLENLKRMGI